MIRNAKYLLLLFLVACGTTRQATKPVVLPDWVQKKPVTADYYNGIGSSPKNGLVAEYQQQAKNNALADLSSEITVNISSKSVLHQFETTLGYSEEYMATTKTESKEDLEGFELVQVFETENQYYIWYRLSKSLYQQLKEQKRQAAVTRGLDFYSKANEFRTKNQYFESMIQYCKGLEIVKPYFSEALEANYQGQNILLANELFSGLLSVVNDISITPKINELKVKNGSQVTADMLEFTCANSKNIPLAGIPILFSLKQKPLQNNTTESNTLGKVSYTLGTIASLNETTNFIATLDLLNRASQITTDPVLRKMLRKIEPPKGQITLLIYNPTFYVSTTEKNLDKELDVKKVEPKLMQWVASQNIPVVNEKDKADFVVEATFNTMPKKVEGKMFYCHLNGEIKVYNQKKELVYIKPVENIQGVQLNYNEAGIDAYKNLTDAMAKNLLYQLKEIIK